MTKSENIEVKKFFDQTGLYLHKRFGIQLRRKIIKELIPALSYRNVMDVGCGDGTLVLDHVEKAKNVWMIDLSANMLDLAKKNIEAVLPPDEARKVKYYHGDFTSFNKEEHFDIILLIGVMAHISDLDSVFIKLKALLKPTGIVVIQYSDSRNLIIKLRQLFRKASASYKLNILNQDVIMRLCDTNNFFVCAQKKFNFPFFGMRYFSDATLYTFQHWLMNQQIFSFLLSDRILVLKNK
jgi:2-polyprenyl-3-methyl-5-hydroxy-6-metoxy-1,4-benzoquinol methylase